jgi:hypothetical protein
MGSTNPELSRARRLELKQYTQRDATQAGIDRSADQVGGGGLSYRGGLAVKRCSLPGVGHIVLTERVWVDDLFGSDRGVQARQRVSLHRSSSPRRMRCRHRQIASALDKDARASWAGASLDHDNSEARRSWTELN